MFIKQIKSLHRKKEDKLFKVQFGKDKKSAESLDILFHHIDTTTGKDKYKLYEPQILQELHPQSYEYKLFMQGFPVKKRILKNFDMACDVIVKAYKRKFNILLKDQDINVYKIEKDEMEYLKKHLPDTAQAKIILTKLKLMSD